MSNSPSPSPWTVTYSYSPPCSIHDGRWTAEMWIGVGINTTRMASGENREECERAVVEFLGSADAKRLESV